MTRRHRTRRGGIGLRVAGSGLCALSCASLRHVLHLHAVDPAHWPPGIVAYALTAVAFLSASVGSAMAMLGHHLFDEVEIGERWRPRRDEPG